MTAGPECVGDPGDRELTGAVDQAQRGERPGSEKQRPPSGVQSRVLRATGFGDVGGSSRRRRQAAVPYRPNGSKERRRLDRTWAESVA